jgi:hypothetical protein
MYDCFINYNSKDVRFAGCVDQRLKAIHFNVWFDRSRLEPGCDWHKEIETCCENRRVVVTALTPSRRESAWTRYETYGAEAVLPLVFSRNWSEIAPPPLVPLHRSFD